MNENFCIAPWFSLYISNKYIKPCCLWSENHQEWSSIDDIKKTWNGEKLRKVRKSFLEGKVPAECSNCFQRIKPRSIFYYEKIGEYIDKSRINLTPPLKPLQVDLKLGNRCNLQCMMCGSWGSCNWLDMDKKLNELNKDFVRPQIDRYDIDVSKFKDCEDMFRDLVRFDFKGGEPMLYDSMVEMLNYLVRWGNTKNIQLSYVTNGSIINKEAIKLWNNFKEVRLVLSIDGIGKLFKYIRGFEFKKYEENIRIYDEIENVKGLQNVAISIYNILDINKINNWMTERVLKKFPCKASGYFYDYDCNVTSPSYLDVRILPKKYKRLALKQFEGGYYENIEGFIKWVKSIQDIPENREQLELFVSFTKYMDKQKGTNFLDIKPEFEELFEEYS